MAIAVFAVCMLACIIGGICGIGGGVIIKPVLDAMGIMSVSAISFLSGLTVMAMAMVNLYKQRKNKLVELKTGSLLAVGAAVGGIAGNTLFQTLKAATGQEALVGMVQAIVLAIVTLMTLIYSAYLRSRLPSYQVKNPVAVIVIGLLVGVISAFLGIGGGPINLAILYFAFSMPTKKAAANSLYMILFSQLFSFLNTCIKGKIPDVEIGYLVVMVFAGIIGGLIGSKINKKIDAATTDKLFSGLMVVIIGICCYNAWSFAA